MKVMRGNKDKQDAADNFKDTIDPLGYDADIEEYVDYS